MKTTPTHLVSSVRALAFAAMLLPASLFAQAFPTWQGTGTNWSDAANWDEAYAYGQLEWKGSGNATSWNNLSSPQSQWRMYFEGGTAYALGGSAVHLFDFGGTNGGILSTSTAMQTINMDLSFRRTDSANAMFINTTGTGGLTFNGQVELTNSTSFLGIIGTSASSDIIFNGSIVGNKGIIIGTNMVLSNGASATATRVFLNGSNSYTGTTVVRAGRLFITNANSLSTNSVIFARPGAVGEILANLEVGGTTTASNTFAFADASTNTTIAVSNNTIFTIAGNLANESGVSAATKFGKSGAGTLILAGSASTFAGQMQIGQGTVIIGQSSSLGTNITTANRGIDLGLNLRDFNQANNVTLLLSNGVTLSNSIYVAANTVSLVNYARTIGISGSGSASINKQIYLDGNLTTDVGSGNTLTISGNLTNTGGVIKTGAGTLILTAVNTNSGALDISNGVVLVSNARAISQNSTGNVVRSGGALELSNNIGMPAAGITINGSGIGGNGAIRSISGSNSINRNITLGSDASIGAVSGANLVISNFATNGFASVNGTGLNLTVAGDGNTRLAANANLITVGTGAGGSLTKAGNGTLSLVGTNTYTGNTTVSGGSLTMFNGASNAILSSNIIINGGNLFHVSGGGNAAHLITNTANMQISSGSYNLQFLNQNLAALDMSGGSLNVTDFAVNQYSAASSVTGGAVNIAGGQGRVIFNNGLALGGGTFNYNSTTNHISSAVRVSNSVTYASTNTAATWFTNAAAGIGKLELAGSTGGVATNTFDIADAGSVASEVNVDWTVVGANSLRKTGNGVLTLGGTEANTYSGNTVVAGGTLALNKSTNTAAIAGNVEVATGGKLLISASEQVADTSAVTLSGGTIERGSGVNETMGNLNLTAASFLDYGTGAIGTLTFGSYSPTLKLSINNFLEGNVLRFTTDLTSSVNNTSLFDFDNGFISDWNVTTSGFFTITAIPEPSTYAAAAGLLGLMLWSPLRRRFARKK